MPAGYSGTPLPKKLGIKEGHKVWLRGAPEGFEETHVPGLPEAATTDRAGDRAPYDVIVAFFLEEAALRLAWDGLLEAMTQACGLWIAWPKKASKVPTDLTEDVIRRIALDAGLVDNKVCAIDQTWSGLRLVIRKENRR